MELLCGGGSLLLPLLILVISVAVGALLDAQTAPGCGWAGYAFFSQPRSVCCQ